MLRALGLTLLLALAGCQTVPDNPATLPSPMPQDGSGRVIVRPFYVPLGMNLVAGVLGGARDQFRMAIFDVTAEPRFLGEIRSPGALTPGLQDAIEYDTAPGTRLLMMHGKAYMRPDYVDFVRVTVPPGGVGHVAISQYGMTDRPYFRVIPLDPRATPYCTTNKGLGLQQASEHFKAQGFQGPGYTVAYCRDVSAHTRFRRAADGGTWSAPVPRERIAELRDRYLPAWTALDGREPPYDLQ